MFLDHVEVVLLNLAPLAGNNLAFRYDENVHAHLRAEHRANVLLILVDCVCVIRPSLEEFRTHGAFVWNEERNGSVKSNEKLELRAKKMTHLSVCC